MRLPLFIDKTPQGKLVSRAEAGQPGYIENVEYQLSITANLNSLEISYYGEDGTYLDDNDIHRLIITP